jgi:hypothetical protein
MKQLAVAAFLLAGLINVFPLIGVLGAVQLESLYGMDFEGADLRLLMRHRAVLFGLVGGLLLLAAFKPWLRLVASVLGLLSMASFMVLAWPLQEHGVALQRVFWADAVGCAVLVIGVLASRPSSVSG